MATLNNTALFTLFMIHHLKSCMHNATLLFALPFNIASEFTQRIKNSHVR